MAKESMLTLPGKMETKCHCAENGTRGARTDDDPMIATEQG